MVHVQDFESSRINPQTCGKWHLTLPGNVTQPCKPGRPTATYSHVQRKHKEQANFHPLSKEPP